MKRILKAFGNSWRGFSATCRDEAAFRQELILCVILVPIACWLDVDPVARVLMIASLVIVLIVELLNTAIESAIDRIGTEHHTLSGQAKDQASAAVLLSLLLAIGVWIWGLWPLTFGA